MTVTETSIKRSIVLVEYIPLQVRAEKECAIADYSSFHKSDISLLELTSDQATQHIRRITLVICAEYHRLSTDYQLPAEYTHGDLLLDSPAEIETDVFYCDIFRNAVKITVSGAPVYKAVLSDNIVWELSERGNLVSVCVIDTTGKSSEHCYMELSNN